MAQPTTGAAPADGSRYDVVVIGAGPAGEVAAGRCAQAGLRVAIVERELVGGECSYWGCIPSKAMLRPGDVLAAAARVPGADRAVTAGPGVDPAAAIAWRDELVGHRDDAGQVPWLADQGVDLVRGDGRLDGPRTVVVDGAAGATRLVAERAVVLATGSRAALPPVPGLADVGAWDNRSVTELAAVPRRLLVVGGGAVGLEMAQAVRRLGAREVTVVEAGPALLAREEPFAGEQVRAALEAEGVVVEVGVRLARAERDATGVRLVTDEGRVVEGDEVLVAAGRRPSTEHLGLDTVGLTPGRPVEVDDALRATGVAGGWLYAIGDCNGRALLTHMGKYQARIAADVIAGRAARDRARDVVPRVTFTDPQVAAVGLTEADARARGTAVRVLRVGTGDVAGSAVRGRGAAGTSQLVVDRATGTLVGATFTGSDVQELLHSATVAIAGRVTLDDLWHAVPSFPTVSEVWLRLLESAGL